jgi:hypothetical protein
MAWLKAHGEVSRFAVLDDEDDQLDELPLFQPSVATGLSEKIAEGLAGYLLGKSDKDMRGSRLERLLQNIHSMIRGHIG